MMNSSVTELSNRLQSIRTEYAINQRKAQESAEQTFKILQSIPPEAVKIVTPIVPQIQQLTKVSVNDLMNNPELAKQINDAIATLSKYLDERLSYYEDQL